MNHFTLSKIYFRSMLILMGILFFVVHSLQSQTLSIQVAKNQTLGSLVTIEGIVTTLPNPDDIRFIQDASGGIGLVNLTNEFNQNVRKGDRIRLRGTVGLKSGQIIISEIDEFNIIDFNVALPIAQLQSSFDIQTSGQRVKLSCIVNPQPESSSWTAGTYIVQYSGIPLELWILQGSPAVGIDRDFPQLEIQGVCFFDDSGWHLISDDINPSTNDCLFWQRTPTFQGASASSLSFDLQLSDTADLLLTAFRQNNIEVDTFVSGFYDSIFVLENLQPSEIYDLVWSVIKGSDTLIFEYSNLITQSLSNKTIQVFFNNPIRDSISSPYTYTLSGLEIEDEIVNRIEKAEESISLALYNFNNDRIRSALDRAHNRGVIVRALVDADNSNFGFRQNPSFPVFYTANGSPLMHNKIIIIDPAIPSSAWLFMGATNLTQNQIFRDPNSAIAFQDQMIAKVYLKEFNELYGSSDLLFDVNLARHGASKLMNTPTLMFLEDIKVESYFSPTDGTTQAIIRTIESAEESVYFSLLTFTQNDIRAAILEAQNRGIEIYGIIENIDDNGGEFYRLQGNGIPVLADDNNFIHHHKYAIIDPLGIDPKLIVGSHNWTQKAEDENDEHTLILHDRDLCLLFLEEFYARYCDIDNTILACQTDAFNNLEFTLSISPNPVQSFIMLNNEGPPVEAANLRLYTSNGLLLEQRILDINFGSQQLWNTSHLPSGLYLLQIVNGDDSITLKVIVQN